MTYQTATYSCNLLCSDEMLDTGHILRSTQTPFTVPTCFRGKAPDGCFRPQLDAAGLACIDSRMHPTAVDGFRAASKPHTTAASTPVLCTDSSRILAGNKYLMEPCLQRSMDVPLLSFVVCYLLLVAQERHDNVHTSLYDAL